MRGATSRAWAGLLAAALICAGCAGPITSAESGYWHRRHDYSVAAPGGPGAAWERVKVEDADLAFRRPGPEILSLQSRCGRPVAAAALMARHLMMGLLERRLVAAGPIEVDGRDAWTQTFDAVQHGVPVRVKTVTLVVRDCTFDWALAAAGPFEPAEAAFDAWWGSFRLGPRYEGEEGR